MENYKVQSQYKLLIQKKSFCGPACIQMALFRRGIWADQEQLAYDIGLRITEGDEDKYSFSFETLPEGDERIGIMLNEFDNKKLKAVLKKHKLKSEVCPISSINDTSKFLIKNITENNDVIANLWLKFPDGDCGHFTLVSEYNSETEEVTLCDPLYNVKNRWSIDLKDLVESMSSKWTGTERGFAVIKDL